MAEEQVRQIVREEIAAVRVTVIPVHYRPAGGQDHPSLSMVRAGLAAYDKGASDSPVV